MITAIIIDDETKGRAVLREKLANYCPQVHLLAEAADGIEALAQLKIHRPQLIFLDIEMPRMNGFEMLNELPEKKFHIIFTTAYDHYAIKAIRYAAFDYLLKPIDIAELQAAIAKFSTKEINETSRQIELLQQNILHPKKHWDKLAIPTLEGLEFYTISDIVNLEATSNYTILYLADKTRITASKTLKDFEELLPEDIFFRTHHSHLINLHYIKRYIKGDGGQIELQNGVFVDLARRKKEKFLERIRNFS